MRSITTLGPRDVIHCPTVREYMDIRTLMLTNGFRTLPKPEDWTFSAHNTCILHDGKVSYLGYCQHQKYNIVTAAELLVVAEPDWDYEDRMTTVNDTETIADYIFLAIASALMWVVDICNAIVKKFSRRSKINL